MKTYNNIDDIPAAAVYLGSENGDGSMYESLADAIGSPWLIQVMRLREPDGTYSYFGIED